MINELSNFEQNVYSHLYWSFNTCSNYVQMNQQQVSSDNNSHKRRKVSESDSLFNFHSAETTSQPRNYKSPKLFHSSNKLNPAENYSGQESQMNERKTAFTPVYQSYTNVAQMNGQNGAFRPVSMPSLNHLSSHF